jgi:predicted Zn-dependent protease
MTTAVAASALDVAEQALRHASGPTQVTVTQERSLVARFARSAPTQATDVDDVTVHVLAWRDGRTGAAVTNRTDDEGMREAVLQAEAAVATVTGTAADHPGLPEPPGSYPVHDGFDSETAAADPEPAGEALSEVFAVAAEAGLEAFGIWTAGTVATAIASSTGVRAFDHVTDAHLKVICRDEDGRSGWADGTAVAAASLDHEAIARRAAAKVPREQPAEVPPGTYSVVLEAAAVGTLLSFLGDLAFNGLAHAEGRGALAGRMGTRVAAAKVSLSDAPRFPRTLPRAFDFEGVPKCPIPLIQDGIAHRVVHDTRSAARAGGGAVSTGHALTPGGSPHGPEPTNLVLLGGGAADEAELAAPIERGILVTRLWYVNVVHQRDAILTGTTRDGTFLIEDGRVTRPLRDVRFTDSPLSVLQCTEELTARQRLAAEPELYGRRFATGVVCPSLRAREVRITGVTPA